MEMAKLPVRGAYRDIVDTFRGYNHNARPADGEAYEMENMCSDQAPLAAVRPRRGHVEDVPGYGGIIMKDKLWWVDEANEGLSNGEYTFGLNLTPTAGTPKTLISMGAYIIVLPDRKYLNTVDFDWGYIDEVYNSEDHHDAVTINPCRANGEDYAGSHIGPTAPDDPEDRDVWVNTSEYPNQLYQWSAVAQVWTPVPVSTIRIGCLGLGEKFQVGDCVVFSGFGTQKNYTNLDTQEELNENQISQIKALDGPKVILECTRDWITVDGIVDARVVLGGFITVKRQMPEMDFVCEHKNRLWGCRYGLDASGAYVNTIYASKLGDFKNWQCYQGIETDSYYANVGSDGPFTGAISYGDMVVFAKENCLHLVYGDGPGSFQVQQVTAPGVQRGSGKSMAIVGGVLYYKGVRDVFAFDGSMPVSIGYSLGGVYYDDAVGGSYGAKYLISMWDREGWSHLFAWDTEKRLWHREDGLCVKGFASGGGETYMLTDFGEILTVGGTVGEKEKQVKWHWQSGVIGAEHPDRKRLQRINVRARMAIGSNMRILVRYDSQGGWILVGALNSRNLRAVDFPVKVRRCDHLELRFEGTGDAVIHSFTKQYTLGSDRR